MTAAEYISSLVELLEKKKSHMQCILDLTQKQSAVIDQDSLEELQKLIDEKQIHIDTINKIDEDFEVYFRRLKSTLNIKTLNELELPGVSGAAALKDETAAIIELIKKISKLEETNSIKAKGLLENLGDEIKKLNQGKKISSAYNPSPLSNPSYFIDKKK